MYRDIKISKIELKNASGTACYLECYYKVGQNDTPIRVGKTGRLHLGDNGRLDLSGLEIPDGAWVTAYSNVASGKDSAGEAWFIFDKNEDVTAYFEISGTAFKTTTSYVGISELYGQELVNKLKLNNQSGTVCSLECYYKQDKEANPNRIGSTSKFPVGQSGTLDLDSLEFPEGKIWVTAYANVESGVDDHCNTWFPYKKGNNKCAEYTITGVINFTTVGFDKVVDVK